MITTNKDTATALPATPASVSDSAIMPGLGYFLQGMQVSIKIRRSPDHVQQDTHHAVSQG